MSICALGADIFFHRAHKIQKNGLTNRFFSVTISPTFIKKAVKGRVSAQMPCREPRLVEWGMVDCGEDGPGAAQAIGSL